MMLTRPSNAIRSLLNKQEFTFECSGLRKPVTASLPKTHPSLYLRFKMASFKEDSATVSRCRIAQSASRAGNTAL